MGRAGLPPSPRLRRASRPALLIRAVICVLLSTAIDTAAVGQEIRLVGSDLLGIEFSKALYDFGSRESVRLALAFDGSRPGAAELRAGRANVGLLALPDEEEFVDAGYASFPVGYHCVIVLVPEGCPLESVTLDQLAGAFGGSGAAPVERWIDLGVTGEWAASAVTLLAPEPGADLVTDHFRHGVLHGRALKTNVEPYANAAALARRFGPETRGIALASRLPPGEHALKCLAIAAGPNAHLPTAENAHRGSYPLALPLRVVFRRDAIATARPVLRFLLGDTAAAELERAGIVAAPGDVRVQALAAVEKM